MTRQQMIEKLRNILPYADTWYNGLADKQLKAIYYRELQKIVQAAIIRDEEEVRARAGLKPLHTQQQALPLY